jgi:hypothetical protein
MFLHPLCFRSCLQCRTCDDPGPLCRAAADGNTAVVQLLIDSFGSVNSKRRTGTPFTVWVDRVPFTDFNGPMSPLRAAILGSGAAGNGALSHAEVITRLIQAKANVDSGAKSKHDSISTGLPRYAKISDLEEAARVCPSSAIITALITASVGHLDLTKSLNAAVDFSNAEAVKPLLEHNADPNAREGESDYDKAISKTCLMKACLHKKNATSKTAVVALLLFTS